MNESLIEYPCAFPVKIMGRSETSGFARTVLDIVLLHDPDFQASSMELRKSREGKYVSITCTVNATSRQQLDALYQALCDHPDVVMVL